MTFFRFFVFILCFYLVVPFDLYIIAHERIYYYGTDLYTVRIPFNLSDPNSNYTFSLQNCKVYIQADSANQSSFFIEYGFTFGTNFSQSNDELDIFADPTQTCIVNLYLPPNLPLPMIYFNITGN